MLDNGSDSVDWENNPKTETLEMAAEGGVVVEDVEEGEISDTASVEEISEEAFKKHEDEAEVKVVKEVPGANQKKVWTMRDLYNYHISGRAYVSGLSSLAWAHAVQNKPFKELLEGLADANVGEERKGNSSGQVEKVVIDDDCSGDEDVRVVDVEKEEGELEEGEIDLDSEGLGSGGGGGGDGVTLNGGGGAECSEKLGVRVRLVCEDLKSVTPGEVEKSFEVGCAKVQTAVVDLRELVPESSGPTKDDLVQSLITAVRVINSVFGLMNTKLKEQNKDVFLRLLSLVKSLQPSLFSPEQAQELETMASSVSATDFSVSSSLVEKETEKIVATEMNIDDMDVKIKSAGHPDLTYNLSFGEPFGQNKPNALVEASKSEVSGFRNRGPLRPLLDLHKDHDLDSLPSPTRDTASTLPVPRVLSSGVEIPKSGSSLHKVDTEEARRQLYETDALKAVSSYQQRFGRSSFFMSDRLPSPTPSEDSADGDGDMGGEISSPLPAGNANPPPLGISLASPSVPSFESAVAAGVIPAKNAMPVISGPTTMKGSAKSRDPRLRYMNADTSNPSQNQPALPIASGTPIVEPVGGISLRKHKVVDDPNVDVPSLKRHRNALENSAKDVKAVSGSGGWLEDSDMVGPQAVIGNNLARNVVSDPRRIDNNGACPVTSSVTSNMSVGGVNELITAAVNNTLAGSGQVPAAVTAVTLLPELLKSIAVNPTMLMNMLKMGQQKLATEGQNPADPVKSTMPPSSTNSILGAGPMTDAVSTESGILPKPAVVPPQISSTDEVGKFRMKPRDPRRVLQNNTPQRTGSVSSDMLKSSAPHLLTTHVNKDNQNMQKQEGVADTKQISPQQAVLPDISLPFTKSLENIADIVSVSQGFPALPLVSQNVTSQPVSVMSDKLVNKATNATADQKIVNASPSEVAAAVSRPQSTWGDVEHLFEGFDEQQKAAIQRERARRIEEQKRMFAARKLCLVLDLDHTLLNSAKFVEVDPVHDEILRKKEEQDRGKSYRHLFRFPHMGMWTKLRPGIWNFLEKASKLFELHLYTMGNKLYATEMAKLLDPKGVLFSGRVISKGDDGDPFDSDDRVPKSKDLEGVLGMESAVVIIDDSVRVWPHNKLNLIVVERYIYFPCSRRQFGLPGPSLLEIDHDERPEDGTLACSLAVIERIHQNFFTHESLEEADVRNILASEQRKILAGCRIVFSRVFPVGEANPHLHPLWQTAEQFGAVCTNQIDEQVTHVVANSLGTDKVNWALSSGKFVVHPGWVEASALLYRRASEQDFAIKS